MNVKSEQTTVAPKRPTAREPILDAAERVAAEIGARHMTLEAVAREAGVSKGGLLYHFPSKDELLSAMVVRYVTRLAEAAPVQGRVMPAVALIKDLVLFRMAAHRGSDGDLRMAHSMIAAVAERPSLIAPLRAYHDQLWARVKLSSDEPERALLPWLAFEGLLFHEIFNTSPLSAEERERVTGAILSLFERAE